MFNIFKKTKKTDVEFREIPRGCTLIETWVIPNPSGDVKAIRTIRLGELEERRRQTEELFKPNPHCTTKMSLSGNLVFEFYS